MTVNEQERALEEVREVIPSLVVKVANSISCHVVTIKHCFLPNILYGWTHMDLYTLLNKG